MHNESRGARSRADKDRVDRDSYRKEGMRPVSRLGNGRSRWFTIWRREDQVARSLLPVCSTGQQDAAGPDSIKFRRGLLQ
jgi:hypothetical protein